MSASAPYWVLYRTTEAGDVEWAGVTFGAANQPATLFFTRRSQAEEVQTWLNGPGWTVAAFDQGQFLEWMRQNVMRGVRTAICDLDPATSTGKTVQVAKLLADALGETTGEG